MRLKIIHFRMIAEFVFRRLERRCPTLHGFGRNVPAEVRTAEMEFPWEANSTCQIEIVVLICLT
jgi:hypothetical protein